MSKDKTHFILRYVVPNNQFDENFLNRFCENVFTDETLCDAERFKLEKTFLDVLFGGWDDQHLFDRSF